MTNLEFDSEYVAKLAAGDKDVAAHFTSYFGSLLRIKLRKSVRSAQLAEDIQQETLLRVFEAAKTPGKIQNPEKLGGFVHAVCRNVMLEMLRRGSPVDADSVPEPADPSDSALDSLMLAERNSTVRVLLESLDQRDRQVLTSVFFEEKDKDRVCQEANVSRNYLRVILFRARSRYRTLLQRRAVGQTLQSGETIRQGKSQGR